MQRTASACRVDGRRLQDALQALVLRGLPGQVGRPPTGARAPPPGFSPQPQERCALASDPQLPLCHALPRCRAGAHKRRRHGLEHHGRRLAGGAMRRLVALRKRRTGWGAARTAHGRARAAVQSPLRQQGPLSVVCVGRGQRAKGGAQRCGRAGPCSLAWPQGGATRRWALASAATTPRTARCCPLRGPRQARRPRGTGGPCTTAASPTRCGFWAWRWWPANVGLRAGAAGAALADGGQRRPAGCGNLWWRFACAGRGGEQGDLGLHEVGGPGEPTRIELAARTGCASRKLQRHHASLLRAGTCRGSAVYPAGGLRSGAACSGLG